MLHRQPSSQNCPFFGWRQLTSLPFSPIYALNSCCNAHCDLQLFASSSLIFFNRSEPPSPSSSSRRTILDHFARLSSTVILLAVRTCLTICSTGFSDFSSITRLLLATLLPSLIAGCSTRPSPKPRPERPYWHPDENLPRLNCTDDYRDLYCLNNGSCYVQFGHDGNLWPYCTCAPGYRGSRCQLIHDDNVYLPALKARRIETAALSAFVTLLVVALCVASLAVYFYRRRAEYPIECVDGSMVDYPFHFRTPKRTDLPRTIPTMAQSVELPDSKVGHYCIESASASSPSTLDPSPIPVESSLM